MNVPAAMRGRADLAGVRLWVLKNAVSLAVSAVLLLAGSGHPAWLAAWAHLGYLVLCLDLVGSCSIGCTLTCWPSGRGAGGSPALGCSSRQSECRLTGGAPVRDRRCGRALHVACHDRLAGPGRRGALLASGSALVLWSMAANPFFSAVVRIQAERGQVVVMSGPYRLVRHPG